MTRGRTPDGFNGSDLMLDAIARSDGTRASVAHQLLTAKVSNGILGNVRTAKLCPGRGNVEGLRGVLSTINLERTRR